MFLEIKCAQILTPSQSHFLDRNDLKQVVERVHLLKGSYLSYHAFVVFHSKVIGKFLHKIEKFESLSILSFDTHYYFSNSIGSLRISNRTSIASNLH